MGCRGKTGTKGKWLTVRRCQRNMVSQGTITKEDGIFWDYYLWDENMQNSSADVFESQFIIMRSLL